MTHLDRRTFLAGTAVTVTAASATTAAHAAGSVDMELVLLAAQLDPVKSGTGLTPGAAESVRAVERALVAEGYLKESLVDGHFGTATREAYSAWQRSLGYTGIDANGIPGRSSLTELGAGRFTLSRTFSVGARTTYQGFPFNARTVAMMKEAFRLAGVTPAVEQGSYSPDVDPTSAGTHDGGGAVDLDAEDITSTQVTRVVRSLRQVGFAAWRRTPAQGNWPLHIHAVAVNDTDLHVTAQDQVGDYYLGRNGLANHAPDDGPQVAKVTWEDYRRGSTA